MYYFCAMIFRFLKDFYNNSSLKLLLSIGSFISALLVLFVITDEIILEKEENIDWFIFKVFHEYIIGAHLTPFMADVTHFSSASFVKIFFPAVMLTLVFIKQYRKSLFLLFAGGGSLVLIYCMKVFFARPRPPYPLLNPERDFSFPSGHATFSFILYGALAYFLWLTDLPRWCKFVGIVFLGLLSLNIGISRVYLRVHYASDVLGGFCLGYSWLFLMIYAFRRWYPLN